jgi:hypothetical protein
VHGTFVGPDALGLLSELARLAPSLAEPLRQLQQEAIERLLDDAGNFTRHYAEVLDQSLNAGFPTAIPVRLFHWSSENHHLGRADGAVRLLSELARHPTPPPGRILLWGHSHGGNVFALMTNLLAADTATRNRFFRAARTYYRWPFGGGVRLPCWQEVRDQLHAKHRPCEPTQLDLVTMGAPVRYGWETGGYSQLLHFVHHRPVHGLPRERAAFPPTLDDVRQAASGDLIQWLGVAGTNLTPPVWAWRTWLADIRLNRMLQRGARRRDLISRWRYGHRVHQEGTTLLVDYDGPSQGHLGQHLAGHAVYTRVRWLLFHAEETVRRFYPADR